MPEEAVAPALEPVPIAPLELEPADGSAVEPALEPVPLVVPLAPLALEPGCFSVLPDVCA
jgi:hypothetical protein